MIASRGRSVPRTSTARTFAGLCVLMLGGCDFPVMTASGHVSFLDVDESMVLPEGTRIDRESALLGISGFCRMTREQGGLRPSVQVGLYENAFRGGSWIELNSGNITARLNADPESLFRASWWVDCEVRASADPIAHTVTLDVSECRIRSNDAETGLVAHLELTGCWVD